MDDVSKEAEDETEDEPQEASRGPQGHHRSFAVQSQPRKPSTIAPPPPKLKKLGDPFNGRGRAGYFPVSSAASRSAAAQHRAGSVLSDGGTTDRSGKYSSPSGSGTRGGRGVGGMRGGMGSRGGRGGRGGGRAGSSGGSVTAGGRTREGSTAETAVDPTSGKGDLEPKLISKANSNEVSTYPALRTFSFT